MRLAYRLLNVFATGAEFSGNPLCVFEDGAALGADTMQRLARQFNLSETTFILPSANATARVRIFTPAYEMPFAGHPTLGTAFVVNDLKHMAGEVRLEMGAGIIPVAAEPTHSGMWRLTANRPRWRAFDDSLDNLANALSLDVSDIDNPVLWVDSGNEQLLLPVKSSAAVLRAAPQTDRLTHFGNTFKVLVFHNQGKNAKARFFFRQLTGFAEDPATGSACANLGGWHLAVKSQLPLSCVISQGTEIGRPSELHLTIDAHEVIAVAGVVRELGRGYVDLT